MITIRLVKTREGLLVGFKASDQFNLTSLGNFKLYADRSQIALKRMRRMFGSWGFKFIQLRGVEVPSHSPTRRECDALGLVVIGEMFPHFDATHLYGMVSV